MRLEHHASERCEKRVSGLGVRVSGAASMSHDAAGLTENTDV